MFIEIFCKHASINSTPAVCIRPATWMEYFISELQHTGVQNMAGTLVRMLLKSVHCQLKRGMFTWDVIMDAFVHDKLLLLSKIFMVHGYACRDKFMACWLATCEKKQWAIFTGVRIDCHHKKRKQKSLLFFCCVFVRTKTEILPRFHVFSKPREWYHPHKQTYTFVEKQAIRRKEAPNIHSINFLFGWFAPWSYTYTGKINLKNSCSCTHSCCFRFILSLLHL